MKHVGFVMLIASLFLAACSTITGTQITGKIKDASNMSVSLDQLYFNGSANPIGKATADAAGNFKIENKEGLKMGLYRVKVGTKMLLLVLSGDEKEVVLEGDFATLERFDMTIKGSEASETYLTFMKDAMAKPRTSEEVIKLAKEAKNPITAALMALQIPGQPDSTKLAVLKSLKPAIDKALANTTYPVHYGQIVQQFDRAVNGSGGAISVGAIAPDIELLDPNGKIRKLSDLRGKIVLLDFWASWCGPCRRENPNVVQVYNKFKAKGFDVFSVSLDGLSSQDRAKMEGAALEKTLEAKKKLWIGAIAQDKLPWENHVSDLMQWECAPAQVYGVQSIPSTFLIGRDGKIIAINPRETLEKELEKVIKN